MTVPPEKMPSKKSGYDPHKNYVRRLTKLQRAGFLKDINPARKPNEKTFRRMERFGGLLNGTEAAVKAPTTKQAKELRKKFGLRGSGKTLIVPREKGESFRVSKGEIKSTRKAYGQTVHKTFNAKLTRPTDNVKRYYTLPTRKRGLGKIKRHTFASFDELLFYLSKYEINFEDIEDHIEVEEFARGSAREKSMSDKLAGERKAAGERLKRRRKRQGKTNAKKSRRKK